MRNPWWTLPVGVLVALAVGLISDDGWPGYLVGAILALSLWVMVLAGGWAAAPKRSRVAPSTTTYALAAAVSVVLGFALYATVGDRSNEVWWAVGFILAGTSVPLATTRRGSADGA